MVNYSKTVKISGEFDAKQILEQLKEIKTAMNGIVPDKHQNDLNKVSKTLEKALETAVQLNDKTKEGFSSDKEVNSFIAGIEKVDTAAKTVVKDLETINKTARQTYTEQKSNLDDLLKRDIQRRTKTLESSVSGILKGTKIADVVPEIKSFNSEKWDEWVNQINQAAIKLNSYVETLKERLRIEQETLRIARATEQIKIRPDKNYDKTSAQAMAIRDSNGNLRNDAEVLVKQAFASALKSLGEITPAQADAYMSSFWKNLGLRQPKIDYASAFSAENKTITGLQENIASLDSSRTAPVLTQVREAADKTIDAINELINKNQTSTKTIDDNIKALKDQANQFASVSNAVSQSSQGWNAYITRLQEAVRAQGKIDSGFATLLNRLKYFLSFTTLLTQVRRQITQTFRDVQELDKSFAEIAMVTRNSVNQMWGSYGRYAEMANELGQATNDVVQASALYYQQGLETNEVLSLTENTMKLATLASIDFSEATDLMTAALRGFKLEMTEGSHITDVYSELAAHAAASVQEIAVAMNKTAAIANSAGMSFENTAAFLTQMIEATQETASNIGTAMKTVIARFTELKENVDDLDEDFEDLEYNKIDKALKSVGVSLKDQNGQFRNLDDVFIELSSHWQNLSRNQQRYIATTAAGSRQQSRFIALIDNYARTMELIDTASESEGRSSQQFEKYADSVEYSIKKLKNTWEQLRVGLLNSDFYKGLAETANQFLEKISHFDKLDWSGLLLAFTTLGRMSMNAFFNGTQEAMGSVRAAITKSFESLKSGAKTRTADFLTGSLGARRYSRETAQMTAVYDRRAQGYSQKLWDLNQEYARLSNEIYKYEDDRVRKPYTHVKPSETQAYFANRQRRQALREEIDETSNNLNTTLANREEYRAGRVTEDQKREELRNRWSQGARAKNAMAVGAAAGAAFTGAFTAAMLSDDPSKVFWSGFISGGMQAVPQMINTFGVAMQEGAGLAASLGTAALGGLMSLGVAALISIGMAAYKKFKVWLKGEQEKELRASNEFYDATMALEELKVKEEELGKKAHASAQAAEASAEAYEKLANKTKELEDLRSKVVLTTEEEQKLIEVSNEIAEIAPNLVSKYDAEGNAVIVLKDSYESLLEIKQKYAAYDELQAKKDATKVDQVKLEDAVREKERQAYLAEHKDDAILNRFLSNPQGLISNVEYTARKYGGEAATNLGLQYAGLPGMMTGIKTMLNVDEKYYTLNDSEKRNLGAMLKTILSDNPDYAQYLTGNNIEIVDNIQNALKDSPDLIVYLNKALKDFIPNMEYLNYQIESGLSTLILDKQAEVRAKANLKSSYFNSQTDQNVQDTMLAFILGNSANEEKLKQTYTTETKKTPEEDEALFEEWVTKNFERIKIDDEALQKTFTEDVISVLNQIKNLKLNLPELLDFMKKNLPENVYSAFVANEAPQIAAYNSKLEQLANIFGSGINKRGDTWFATGANAGLVQALMNVDSEDFLSKLQKWDRAGRRDEFISMFEGLEAKDINEIFSFDWKSVSAKNYEEQLDALEETVSAKRPQIEKILNNIGLTDFAARSLGEFKDGIEEDMKSFKNFDKSINAVRTAGTSWIKDGKVSAAGIEALADANYDLTKIVSEDLQFNTAEALKQTEEQLELEYQNLKLKMAANEELYKQYQLINAINDSISLTDLKKQGITPDQIDQFFIKESDGRYSLVHEVFDAAFEAQQELVENQKEAAAGYLAYINARKLEVKSVFAELQKDQEEMTEKRVKAEKEVKEAYEDVLEKQQDVIDKQKELNEILYGEDFHKNKLDELYNYTTALDVYTDAIKEAKDELDNLEGRSPTEFIDEWFGGTHNQAANLAATNTRYETAIRNTQNVLTNRLADYLRSAGMSNNVSDFFYYDSSLDRYGINYGALNGASMNDSLRDFIEEQVDLMNQYKKNIKKNQDELKNLEKEFKDYQKKARDNYISVQEEVAKKLEEFYKKQVDDKKEMYDALEEADNEYLDALQKAIDKQRKLRDKESKWNDLALKEKKLSLMQRDTSGANQKSVQSLRREIDKDRQSMLDDAVDTIIDDLKELYEMQQETRETELEYQENLLENSNYIAEANSLLQSWKTVDEMRDWMWAHTEDIDKMSDEAVEKLTEDWATMFDNIQVYNEISQREITSIFDVSAQEVQDIVLNTSETLTTEADRAFGEITNEVNEAIQSAREAVEDAMEALADAQEKYNEKVADLNEILNQTTEIVRRMADLMGVASSSNLAIPYGNNMAMDAYNAANRDYENWKPIDQIIAEASFNSVGIAHLRDVRGMSDEEIIAAYGAGIYGEVLGTNERGNISYEYYKFRDESALNNYVMGLSLQDRGKFRRFKSGGLANYTGLAYVDGTTNRPEAFLSAEDTARMGEAADIFRQVARLGTNGTLNSALSNVSSETNSTVNIFVDSIATEEQVDYLINRMKEEQVKAANPIGASIILRQ